VSPSSVWFFTAGNTAFCSVSNNRTRQGSIASLIQIKYLPGSLCFSFYFYQAETLALERNRDEALGLSDAESALPN
jgi:hypothetical protein